LKENFNDNGFIIIYLDYKVLIRKYGNGKIILLNGEENFEPKFIQKLRLFNETQEFYIWKTEDKYKGRMRIDEEGEETDVIEANQVLFGTKGEVKDGKTIITEERGTEITLPFEINGIDTKENRVKIKTINYIGYNEHGQAGYADNRFAGFTFGKENKSIGE